MTNDEIEYQRKLRMTKLLDEHRNKFFARQSGFREGAEAMRAAIIRAAKSKYDDFERCTWREMESLIRDLAIPELPDA